MQHFTKTVAGGARFPVLVLLAITAAAMLAVPVLDAKAVALARGPFMDAIDQGSVAFVQGVLPE